MQTREIYENWEQVGQLVVALVCAVCASSSLAEAMLFIPSFVVLVFVMYYATALVRGAWCAVWRINYDRGYAGLIGRHDEPLTNVRWAWSFTKQIVWTAALCAACGWALVQFISLENLATAARTLGSILWVCLSVVVFSFVINTSDDVGNL